MAKMSLFNIFAPTSTSLTSQTLHNTATQPAEQEGEQSVLSSPLSSQPKDTLRKRGRPKKIISSPEPSSPLNKIAPRGRGRPKKIPLSPSAAPAPKKRGRPPKSTNQTSAMARASARNRAEGGGGGENGEPSLPVELRRQDGEVSVTPVGSDDENEDEDEDDNSEAHGERISRFLKKAFKEVKGTTPKAAKGKRGQPKGGWKKKTNATPTRKSPRSTRKAAKLSAQKTSEDYALTSDPGADPILGTAAEDTPAKGTRDQKRASLADEVDEEGEESPPKKKRGRPPKDRAEQPPVERARLLQGYYEPITVDADEMPFTGKPKAPKRKPGRPSNQVAAEAAGPTKGRGGRAKKGATTTADEGGLFDPDTLSIGGFTFKMVKTEEGNVFDGQFDFVPHEEGADGDGSAYQIERTEDGRGFTMKFKGHL